MLVDVGYKTVVSNALKAALETGATVQVWAGPVPETPTVAPVGTKLAEAAISASQVTVNAAGALVLGGVVDTAIDATGTPTFMRVVSSSLAMQFTAKMAAGAGGAEVVLTDADESTATQILQNRKLTINLTLTTP